MNRERRRTAVSSMGGRPSSSGAPGSGTDGMVGPGLSSSRGSSTGRPTGIVLASTGSDSSGGPEAPGCTGMAGPEEFPAAAAASGPVGGAPASGPVGGAGSPGEAAAPVRPSPSRSAGGSPSSPSAGVGDGICGETAPAADASPASAGPPFLGASVSSFSERLEFSVLTRPPSTLLPTGHGSRLPARPGEGVPGPRLRDCCGLLRERRGPRVMMPPASGRRRAPASSARRI